PVAEAAGDVGGEDIREGAPEGLAIWASVRRAGHALTPRCWFREPRYIASPAMVHCCPEIPVVQLADGIGEFVTKLRNGPGRGVCTRLLDVACARDDSAHAVQLGDPGQGGGRRFQSMRAGKGGELACGGDTLLVFHAGERL